MINSKILLGIGIALVVIFGALSAFNPSPKPTPKARAVAEQIVQGSGMHIHDSHNLK